MHRKWLLFLAFSLMLVACGKSGDDDDNATPIPTPTPTPTPGSCVGPDPAGASGLVVPVATAPNGDVLHWCPDQFPIPVTYEAAASAILADINDALSVWANVSCSPLTFGTPTENANPPSGQERRIHIALLPSGAAEASRTNNNFLSNSGEIVSSLVETKETSSIVNRTHLAVGQALGLAIAPNGTESIMAGDYGATVLASDDAAALCYIYPTTAN